MDSRPRRAHDWLEVEMATDSGIPEVDERVLSTLNKDGTRRWLRPKLSLGRFLLWRRVVAYGLILIFTVLPWLKINGLPPILLDVPAREFTFFGKTFLPTDTLLLALLLLSIFVSIFLLTAFFGRVWCGWACPQTVYMEFLYRPIERLFEGRHYRTGGKAPLHPARRIAKYAVFLVVSLFLAHTFLAYFVGVDELFQWMQQSPLEHPKSFLTVMFVTGLMMFDFCFFREQVCVLMCPYGRFQSVLLDKQSMIVSYDPGRGEPRGKLRRTDRVAADKPGSDLIEGVTERGDCIDCHLCVVTCPTGIDIREGLQMECIGCTQCIDACDEVMDRIGRPRGLIRYSSQAAMETGRLSLLRPRVVIYPVLLIGILTAFGFVLASAQPVDVAFLRARTSPYRVLDSGDVESTVQIKLTNRTREPRQYDIELLSGGRMTSRDLPVTVEGGDSATTTIRVTLAADAFSRGAADIDLRIHDDGGYSREFSHGLIGPLFGFGSTADETSSTGETSP